MPAACARSGATPCTTGSAAARAEDEGAGGEASDAAADADMERARRLVEDGRELREKVVSDTTELLKKLDIATDANLAAAGTLGAHRELLSRDIGAARLRAASSNGDRVLVGPYAGCFRQQVTDMKAFDTDADIFSPHPFGLDVDHLPAIFHAQLDWARSRTAFAMILFDSEKIAHDMEMAVVKGEVTEGQKELHKRNQEHFERWQSTAMRRRTASFSARPPREPMGAAWLGRITRAMARAAGRRRERSKRGDLENERQILQGAIEENAGAVEQNRARLEEVEASIASFSKPNEPPQLVNQKLVANRDAKGQLVWPFDVLYKAKGFAGLKAACESTPPGMVTITPGMRDVLIAKSNARFAKARQQLDAEVAICKQYVIECANGADQGLHDLTAEGAQKRRAVDPADAENEPNGKRRLSKRGEDVPTFEEYLNENLGGAARMHNTKQQRGRRLLVDGRDERNTPSGTARAPRARSSSPQAAAPAARLPRRRGRGR